MNFSSFHGNKMSTSSVHGGQSLITVLSQITPVNMPGPSHSLWYDQEDYKLRYLSLCSCLLPPAYSLLGPNFPPVPCSQVPSNAFKGVRTSDLPPSIFFLLLKQETKFNFHLMLQVRFDIHIFRQAGELMTRKHSQHFIGFNILVYSTFFSDTVVSKYFKFVTHVVYDCSCI